MAEMFGPVLSIGLPCQSNVKPISSMKGFQLEMWMAKGQLFQVDKP